VRRRARGSAPARIRTRAGIGPFLAALSLLLPAGLGAAGPADAAPAPAMAAPPDAAVAAPPDTAGVAADTSIVIRRKQPASLYRPGLDRHRIEIGVGPVHGYFDAVGTFGYRRYVRERHGWAQFAVGEVSGTTKGYLSEGVLSVYYLVRNTHTWKPGQRLRPILEAGPGAHLAVQSAHLIGFNSRPFHAKVFLKAHVYVGVEALASQRVGFLVRGRLSVPDHRPMDYAQAAIFFR
jgi:hypothetical protein